ncbi:hypothetical protein BCR36DRAFT_408879 [Piromyces finnis]|uniref:Uncharacterized protein n=1 Tax=Piromyces finnis TaxID=1754191 RepID=A0A1Y1VKS6_9FUNG|nr:hypothetical protein BCR36DRAFT_408879 [Piromyces finnis]|eukprot:ORX58358.1 hypothetical protein BCR36DRAFT_408879 [Piromyces finnis]
MDKIKQKSFDNDIFSDIEDIYKPTDASIQKELVNSITNLSNLLSNGLVFINYNIYENLKQANGLNYAIPNKCKVLSEVINNNSKKNTLKQFKRQHSDPNKSKNNDSINIIITNVDKEEPIDEYFSMEQSMIKPHQDFNIGAESSMLFDQSVIFSNIDIEGDNVANQSMIFMDSNGRNIFSHENSDNHGSMFLNGLTDLHIGTETEGNNSTLVNLVDVDNNYLSSSDVESNNSTACWDDKASVSPMPGKANDFEEYSDESDDQPLKNEFNQAFSKKYPSLDTNAKLDLYNSHSLSTAIQVHQYQITPEEWNNEDDEINMAKAIMKKQGYKNASPHKKLYPVIETPYLNESNSSTVNNKDTINSSFIKDDLSITKNIVNKNVKKFNSMGIENKYIQKINSSNINYHHDSTPKSSDNNLSTLELNLIASPSQSVVSKSPSIENVSSVNNFASLQFKFNQNQNNSNEYQNNKTNHNWSYKIKQELKNTSINEENHQQVAKIIAIDDTLNDNSIIIPEKLNIKDRINDIEASILINNSTNEFSDVNQAIIKPMTVEKDEQSSFSTEIPKQNESNDVYIINATVNKSEEVDDIEDISTGTVKDIVVDLEENKKNIIKNDNSSLLFDSMKKETIELEKQTLDKNNNSIENKGQLQDSIFEHEEIEQILINNISSEVFNERNEEETNEEPIEYLSDNEKTIEEKSKISKYKNEDTILEENEQLSIEKEKDKDESKLHQQSNIEEEPIEFLTDNEDENEEPIEFLMDNEDSDENELIDYIDNNDENNEKIVEQSLLFENGTKDLINGEIIDGNLEDHIIIEEEDSIIGNAIEEALENKSFVIQENSFMDEPYANDLSFSFDGHTAFHEVMKIFEENTVLETIKEEEDIILNEEDQIENDNKILIDQLKIEENIINENDNKEVKILELIENNINEPNNIKMNDMIINSFIHENQDIIHSILPLTNDELLPVNSELSNEQIIKCDKEQDILKSKEIIPSNEAIKVDKKEINSQSVDSSSKSNKEGIEKEENKKQTEIKQNENSKAKSDEVSIKNNSNKIIQRKKKVSSKLIKKSIKSLEKAKKISSNNNRPKTIKKSNKSLVLPTRNLMPTINKQVNSPISNNNFVKAFTSTSLKQNIVNIRPIEKEITVSFSDFDNSNLLKLIPKSKTVPKITPKIITKPVSKSTPKSNLVYESKVKPLIISKSSNKTSTKKSISKINKKAVISKPERKISKSDGSSVIINERSLKKDIPPSKIIPEQRNKNKKINNINKAQLSNSKTSSSFIVASKPKIIESKNTNGIKEKIKKCNSQKSINYNYEHITYYPKSKRKTITQYPTDIRSKGNIYYKWVKELLPEYSHKFIKYELCDVMSKSYVFEAIIRKLSPEYKSSDYNPRRNIFRTLLPLDNINKFNEIFEYIQNHMNITVVITAYDLHFGNLSSIFIIIKQLQRYENNHPNF